MNDQRLIRSGVARVDQFVPSLVRHDAIGNHALQLQKLLLGAGYESEIWYEHLDPALVGRASPFRDCPASADPSRTILYHASTDSEMAPWLVEAAAAGQRLVLDYHNITPSYFFAGWEPKAARSMDRGREQLQELIAVSAAALADSEYNAAELRALGLSDSVSCPILLDLEEYHAPPDPGTLARLQSEETGARWLFVGRIAPNKCQHDIIASFACYRRLYDPDARLTLVGAATSPRYLASLGRMITDLDLGDAVEMAGSKPFSQLLAYFRASSVFVCLSEHEGFCVPVVEAMELDLPVVGFASSAVTETVADAGVLLSGKDPLQVALAVHQLLGDDGRRAEAVRAGRQRAASFGYRVSEGRWAEQLTRLVPRG